MAGYDGLNPDFAARLRQLVEASGGRVWINSGYRSVAQQQALWNAALKKYGSAAAARKWVAPPGKSNHNSGHAVDLGGDLALAGRLAPRFGLTRPMAHEPWHFEPVGHRGKAGHTPPPDPHDHAPVAPGVPEQTQTSSDPYSVEYQVQSFLNAVMGSASEQQEATNG